MRPRRRRREPRPGLVAAPALARSAVRVPVGSSPDRIRPVAGPSLFVHEGARQVLERRLRQTMGRRITLAITDNRQTMVYCHRAGRTTEVRVHHMFLDADPFTQRALGAYLKDGDRAASEIVGGFIDANQQRIRPGGRRPKPLTQGTKHDLGAIYDRLNDRYFAGMADASITWARRTRPANGRARKSIKLGTYCADQKLIRIHPALDQAWVPRYFVEYVVYHEMLHHMLPMPMRDGRRQLHTAAFFEAEKGFRHYARAMEWEQQHLLRLLRY